MVFLYLGFGEGSYIPLLDASKEKGVKRELNPFFPMTLKTAERSD